jgi:hypothetical protein
MGQETLKISQWLYQTLASDPVLQSYVGDRIVEGLADTSVQTPFILFAFNESSDKRVVGGERIWTYAVYMIKAIGEGGSFAPLQPIVDRIDAVLDRARGSVPGAQILYCERDRPFQYVTWELGSQWRHIGAYWYIYIQEV